MHSVHLYLCSGLTERIVLTDKANPDCSASHKHLAHERTGSSRPSWSTLVHSNQDTCTCRWTRRNDAQLVECWEGSGEVWSARSTLSALRMLLIGLGVQLHWLLSLNLGPWVSLQLGQAPLNARKRRHKRNHNHSHGHRSHSSGHLPSSGSRNGISCSHQKVGSGGQGRMTISCAGLERFQETAAR